MSIGPVNNTNAQAIDFNAGGQPETGAVHNRNEALGNVHASSKLATAGRIALGILTLGISEGIRALVKHFASRPSANARINQPNVSAPEEPQTNFKFDQIETALGRPMKGEEKSNLRTIEQELLHNVPKKALGKAQVQKFQEKLVNGLDQLNHIHCSDKTKDLSKTVLMQHPRLVDAPDGKDLEKSFFETALFGPFRSLESALKEKNLPSIKNGIVNCGTMLLSELRGYNDPLNDARLKLKAYHTIETYGFAEPFKALSNDAVTEIGTYINKMTQNRTSHLAHIFFDALMQYRN